MEWVAILLEEDDRAVKWQGIDSVVVVGTDEVELRRFDNKGILEYFKEKEYLSIVKEWNSKGGKQLARQQEKLGKRRQEKLKKMQPGEHSKSNKE